VLVKMASNLWPTTEPKNIAQLGANTAYGAIAGAMIAEITKLTTIEKGAIYGGVLYLVIAGVKYVVRLDPYNDDPHSNPIKLDPGKALDDLLQSEINEAWKQGPALDIRPLKWGSIDLQPYVKCGTGPQPPPGLGKYGHIIQKYC